MAQTVLSESDFRSLISQQGLSCKEAEFSEFYEAYGMVRAMAVRVRQPRSHMAEPMAIFAPVPTAST